MQSVDRAAPDVTVVGVAFRAFETGPDQCDARKDAIGSALGEVRAADGEAVLSKDFGSRIQGRPEGI